MAVKIIQLIFFCFLLFRSGRTEKTVCYFGSWSVYRQPQGTFDVENIDPFICTDVIFGFAGVDNQTWTIEVLDPWNENCPDDIPAGSNCAYDRFVALKQQNPTLITTLGVGGWNEGSSDFSVMAEDPAKRSIFINSAVELITSRGFDGLDVDWEYPTDRGGIPEDKVNFVTLLRELREAFDVFNPPLLLTAALAAGKPTIDAAYDVPGFVNYLDFFHIMSYDFHGAWENNTHHNSPLCGYSGDTGNDIYFRVDYALDYWLQLGAPKEKLVIGIAVYGRCWTLDNVNDNGMRAPAHNPSPAGPYTSQAGSLAYNEICERLLSVNCPIVHDPNLQEPYFYCPDDGVWCGYDDEDSVYKKARFAKNRGIAGALVWTIDQEDFHPTCGPIANPLITKINQALSEPADAVPFECPALGWS